MAEVKLSSHGAERRRVLLGGATAAAVVSVGTFASAGPARPADNYDELQILIDQRAELLAEWTHTCRERERIEQRPDWPAKPCATIDDIDNPEHVYHLYCWANTQREMRSVGVIDAFFENKMREAHTRARLMGGEFCAWPPLVERDWHHLKTKFIAMQAEYDAYCEASGYNAIDHRETELSRSQWAVEDRVFSLPCLSSRDVDLKLGLIDTWFDGGDSADASDLLEILRSIRGALHNLELPEQARA